VTVTEFLLTAVGLLFGIPLLIGFFLAGVFSALDWALNRRGPS
jgi:hypothetical protein